METTLTFEEAHRIITAEDFNGYGSNRLYGIIGEGDTAGQIYAIKSTHHLEKFTYSRIYRKTNVTVPIFKA